MPKAIALSCESYDMSVMYKTVDQGSGEAVISENRIPLAKLQIGGNDYTDPFITF